MCWRKEDRYPRDYKEAHGCLHVSDCASRSYHSTHHHSGCNHIRLERPRIIFAAGLEYTDSNANDRFEKSSRFYRHGGAGRQ